MVSLFSGFKLYAQCDDVANATPRQLLDFLNSSTPDAADAKCLTEGIRSLGGIHPADAAGTLTRFLDFRRPPTARAKQGLYVRPQTIDELYPAAYALEMMGRDAAALSEAIRSPSTLSVSRENAISVWMELHKDEASQGVALPVKESQLSSDPVTQSTPRSAASDALKWCGPADLPRCKAALAEAKP